MAKVMLVEDDNNLREIYEARLAAEGYEIVSAADGEAALALAIKEKPDLIISDIMMPKVSGFDMLDILRSTTKTKNCKIIMMTALNQAEDKARAEKLGADMYLVKSQVTLEDVVRAAKGVLGDQTPLSVGGVPVQHPATPTNTTSLTGGTPAPAAPQTPPATVAPQTTVPEPVAAAPIVATPATTPVVPQAPVTPAPTPAAPADQAPSTAQEEAALQAQIEQFISADNTPAPAAPQTPPATVAPQTTVPEPVAAAPIVATPATVAPQTPVTPAPVTTPPTIQTSSQPLTVAPAPAASDQADPQTTALNEDKPAGEQIIVKSAAANSAEPGIDASISGRKKVIQPISDVLSPGPDLNALAAKEAAAVTSTQPLTNSVVTPQGATVPVMPASPTMNDIIAPSASPQAPTEPTVVPPPVA